MSRILAPIVLYCALVLVAGIYAAGLSGPFLFDDTPNLGAMGTLGDITDWESFKAFVFGGGAGPSGRPLSLLTFLINDNTWPSVAEPFKYTNLCLHLLVGLLLTWTIYLLLRMVRVTDQHAAWLAVLAASIWLLHPFWVSTTLYVVQRMTILCTLFMLAGMVGYLKGRVWLMQSREHAFPWPAYTLMTISAGAGTILAVLSKENGALLPMLLLVLEAFLYRMHVEPASHKRLHKVWVAVILGLPSLAVIAYLVKHVDFAPDLWPTRPFNQIERLYSEARIVWDYLGQLWFPRIEGSGLYQDGFVISRSLTEPISTLWAVAAWAVVLLILPWLYRRWPYVWLAMAFFLCGHLIESTVIGLELHFEHRNYAPALFMFLPAALAVDWIRQQYSARAAAIVVVLVVSMLGFMTWQRSQLWADADRLQTYWALKDPSSARGRNFMISRLVDEKRYADALAWADQSVEEMPNSALMTMSWLRIHVNTAQADAAHFERAAQKLSRQPFDAQAVAGLRTLVDDVIAVPALSRYRQPMLGLLDQLATHGPYRSFPLFMRLVAYSKARLYLSIGDVPQAQSHYLEAIDRYGRASSAMQMFSEVAEAGHIREASQLLDHIKHQLLAEKLDAEPLGEDYFLTEIRRMQDLLAMDASTVQ